jgi:tRNA (guanine-N7-)-methyltransferase
VVELLPETYFAPLNLVSAFGREAPLHVDLGCGDGSFLCELAERYPEKNFLGVDKMAGRVAKTCQKAVALENVRALNVEISYAVRYLLPPESVETFYLAFPDPWPKRRHHRRRLFTNDFLDSVNRTLERAGTLRITTDQRDYFNQIDRAARNYPSFMIVDVDDVDLPATKFEKRFRQHGAQIYRLALRKISPVT